MTRGNLSVPSNLLSSLVTGGGQGGRGTGRVSLNTGETGLAAAAGGKGWNVWAAYGDNNVSTEFTPLQSGGDVKATMVGLDYFLANGMIVGAALSIERTKIATPYNGGNVNGDGYSLAPYLSWQINRNWSLDATLGWGWTDLDSSFGGGVTGSNEDSRFFGALSGAYNTEIGKAVLTGRAAYLYARDSFDAFTASDGTAIPGHDSRLGQLRIGGQAGYAGDGFMPYVAAYYVYDTQRDNLPTLAGQTPANDRSAFLLQVGINVFTRGGFGAGLSWATETGRSQSDNDQLLLNASFRF